MADADLQELVDDLASHLGRPVLLEDRRLRLLAHSRTGPTADEVRVRSILARQGPAEVAAWLDELGVERLTEPAELPPNAGLHMEARLCAPVRHEGVLLGYLWLQDPPFTAGEREAVARAAIAIAPLLHRRRREEDGRRGAERAALERLCDGAGPDTLRAAGLDPAAPAALVVLRGAAPGAPPHPEGAAHVEAVLERATHGALRVLRGAAEWVLVVLGRLPAGVDLELGAGLVAGLDGAPEPLSGLPARLAEVRRAALAAQLDADLGPVARVEDVALERHLLALAGDDPARLVVPEPVRRLVAEHPELAAALRAHLDGGGDAAATAAQLHVSRASLYRRLARAQAAVGLDPRDGRARALVHLGLVAARLS